MICQPRRNDLIMKKLIIINIAAGVILDSRYETGSSRFEGITYGLWEEGCYTDTRRGLESYTETI